MNSKMFAPAAVLATVFGTPVLAHHSFAMFDQDKTSSITGSVKEFEWDNPHVWLNVTTMSDGKPAMWSFEAGAPNQLAVSGWNPNSVKPGDKLVVNFHPLKDGSHGGMLLEVTFTDGHKLCQGPDCRAAAGINIPGGRPRTQD